VADAQRASGEQARASGRAKLMRRSAIVLWLPFAGLLLLIPAVGAYIVRSESRADLQQTRATAESELDLLTALTAEMLARQLRGAQ
jgi:hypothetical protein